jgi:hypothetical protein
MVLKILLFAVGLVMIGILFLVQNAFSKPVYNKMSNVWEDDSDGRKISQTLIIIMLVVAFLLGRMSL